MNSLKALLGGPSPKVLPIPTKSVPYVPYERMLTL